jgi:hypothetical protein
VLRFTRASRCSCINFRRDSSKVVGVDALCVKASVIALVSIGEFSIKSFINNVVGVELDCPFSDSERLAGVNMAGGSGEYPATLFVFRL